jgi:flagellar motility protein MotE (MotC chaperone)
MKDIVALGALAVVSFPVVLLGVLLWTGNVRMVFGPESQDPMARAKLLERPEDIPGATRGESDSGRRNGTDSGLQARAEELDKREAELVRMNQRIQMVQQDDERLRDTIRMERQRLESILGRGDSLEAARVTVLAATFGGMKADQAAKIIASLDDVLATAILRKVSDDKPRAKILAALGKLDVQRAARLARLLAAVPSTRPAPRPQEAKEPATDSTAKPKAETPDTARKTTEKKP